MISGVQKTSWYEYKYCPWKLSQKKKEKSWGWDLPLVCLSLLYLEYLNGQYGQYYFSVLVSFFLLATTFVSHWLGNTSAYRTIKRKYYWGDSMAFPSMRVGFCSTKTNRTLLLRHSACRHTGTWAKSVPNQRFPTTLHVHGHIHKTWYRTTQDKHRSLKCFLSSSSDILWTGNFFMGRACLFLSG